MFFLNISKGRAKLNMARLLSVLSVLLWDIQQRKLRLSPFEQHGVAFSFVVAEGYILTVDVPVASFQLLD